MRYPLRNLLRHPLNASSYYPRFLLVLVLSAALGLATAAEAQEPDTTGALPNNPYGTGAGFQLMLTNSGFGLGGYGQWTVSTNTSLLVETSISAGKDRREQKFFDFFGRSIIPNKANYFLKMPIRIGLHRRLFREDIRENFRPFVQASAGPTFGWQWPYFADNNDNGIWEPDRPHNEQRYGSLESFFKGETRVGMGGMVGVGVFWGMSRRTAQGVRIGYSFNYFPDGVQLMELSLDNARRNYFGSPTISLVFGRLW